MKKTVSLDEIEKFIQKFRRNPSIGEGDDYVRRLFVWLPHKYGKDQNQQKNIGLIEKGGFDNESNEERI